jgi:hypothetical protein
MTRTTLLFAVAATMLAGAAAAQPTGNAACWGDTQRQDISCARLTENFLLNLRRATRDEVTKAMGVEGRPFTGEKEKNIIHFLSNYARGQNGGDGAINFRFDQSGRVDIIFGAIEQKGHHYDFIWNAELLPNGCSDLPNTRMARCADVGR